MKTGYRSPRKDFARRLRAGEAFVNFRRAVRKEQLERDGFIKLKDGRVISAKGDGTTVVATPAPPAPAPKPVAKKKSDTKKEKKK